MLSEKTRTRILEIKGRYPNARSATLPSLYAAQDEMRWLSAETIDEVAALLEMPARMLHEVATFYVMFEKKPVGTHLVEVCDNISCALRGGEELLRSRGVEVVVLDDPECVAMMEAFIAKRPELWNEDIGE